MKIKELIVVEGKSDIDFLSSFLEADFYQVHDELLKTSDIYRETYEIQNRV